MSISRIQRECSLGFNRAGRYFLRLQKDGIVSEEITKHGSLDLQVRYLRLTGWCTYVGYPASKRFVNDLKGFIFYYENEYLGFKDILFVCF